MDKAFLAIVIIGVALVLGLFGYWLYQRSFGEEVGTSGKKPAEVLKKPEGMQSAKVVEIDTVNIGDMLDNAEELAGYGKVNSPKAHKKEMLQVLAVITHFMFHNCDGNHFGEMVYRNKFRKPLDDSVYDRIEKLYKLFTLKRSSSAQKETLKSMLLGECNKLSNLICSPENFKNDFTYYGKMNLEAVKKFWCEDKRVTGIFNDTEKIVLEYGDDKEEKKKIALPEYVFKRFLEFIKTGKF